MVQLDCELIIQLAIIIMRSESKYLTNGSQVLGLLHSLEGKFRTFSMETFSFSDSFSYSRENHIRPKCPSGYSCRSPSSGHLYNSGFKVPRL